MKYLHTNLALITFACSAALAATATHGQVGGQSPPQQPPPQQPPQQQVSVVATVNGDPISAREVQANLEPQLQGQQVDPAQVQQMRKQVLDNIIDSRLVEQYALKKGPDVAQEEVDTVINRVKQQLAQQNVEFAQYVAARGHTPASFKTRIEGSVAWQKLQQEQINDESLQQFFNANQQQFNAENFEDVRQQVTNAYVGHLWRQIVGEMKPQAEIEVAGRQPPGGGQPVPQDPRRQPAPPQSPRGQQPPQ
jgi:hypothetical protein